MTGFVKPNNALVDTGAEVKIMISETIANALGLTWAKDSVKLVGVGGDGGSLGQSDQTIRLYLGGYMGNASKATPFAGSFSIMLRPLIMTARMERDIKHEVLIGQALLHLCLGSVDSYMRHLEYSPAWFSDCCPEFRVRIPCKMTRSPVPRVGVLLAGFPEDGDTVEELLAHNPGSAVMMARRQQAERVANQAPRSRAERAASPERARSSRWWCCLSHSIPGSRRGLPLRHRRLKSYHDSLMQRKQEGRSQARNVAAQAAAEAFANGPSNLKPTHLTFAVTDLRAAGMLSLDGAALLLPSGRRQS